MLWYSYGRYLGVAVAHCAMHDGGMALAASGPRRGSRGQGHGRRAGHQLAMPRQRLILVPCEEATLLLPRACTAPEGPPQALRLARRLEDGRQAALARRTWRE